jgi:phosphoribosyl 1,2-cyclic phosphodiesterase
MTTQRRHTGGLWLHLADQEWLLDPGPGSLARAWASRPHLDPGTLDAVLVSHHHVDHCTDANVMIEAMTGGGHRRRGALLAPREALEGDSPLCRYVQAFPERVEVLHAGASYRLGGVTVTCPLRHRHSAETYGLIVETAESRWGYLVDTAYFDELAEAYAGLDLLIVSTVLWDNPKGLLHLTVAEGERLLAAARPRRGVLSSFGMNVLNHHPWQLARAMTDRLGFAVIAAEDGMTLALP